MPAGRLGRRTCGSGARSACKLLSPEFSELVAALINNVHTDLVSERLRNDQYHPQWGLLFEQAWVR